MFLRHLALLIAFGAAAFAVDVTGKWTAEFDTQIGLQKYTYEFKVDGTKLTGRAKGGPVDRLVDSEIKEGKVSGDEVMFAEMFKFEDNEIRIDYKGKVTGDEIRFTRQVGDFATEELVAKRVK